MKVLDLFCGAGGFSEGFRSAGFKIVAGIDNDKNALETFSQNFKESITLNLDLSTPSIDSQLKIILKEGVDLVIGGPPCQGFSIAGKRLVDDPRNQLYKAYLDIVRLAKPYGVIIENVPNIMSYHNGRIATEICKDLEGLGFSVKIMTLIASDFGVPQSRKRTFFIALKPKLNNLFQNPKPVSLFNQITCEMALSDLPLLEKTLGQEASDYDMKPQTNYQKLMRKSSSILFNHSAVNHTEQTKSIIKMVPDGGNYKNLPISLQKTRKVNIAWTRMNSKKPCFTIDAGHNHHFHYQANRVPTVRECARIQSFPDMFKFYGNRTSQYRQVGNAVPPLLGKAIAKELMNVFKNLKIDKNS